MNMIAKKLEAARCASPGGGEVGMAEGVGGAGSAAGASFGGASLLGGAVEGAEAPTIKKKLALYHIAKYFLKLMQLSDRSFHRSNACLNMLQS